MPHWWNETLTLYRRLESKDDNGRRVLSWKRETLRYCFAKNSITQIYGGGQVVKLHEAVFPMVHHGTGLSCDGRHTVIVKHNLQVCASQINADIHVDPFQLHDKPPQSVVIAFAAAYMLVINIQPSPSTQTERQALR
jgi:hypothetical protein